jgi:hypothetical protein
MVKLLLKARSVQKNLRQIKINEGLSKLFGKKFKRNELFFKIESLDL